MLKRHSHVTFTLAVIFDASLVSGAWLVTYVVRFRLGIMQFKELTPPGVSQFAQLLPIVIVCNLIALGYVGLYKPTRRRSLLQEWMQVAKGAVLAWLAMLSVLYYYSSTPFSRKMLFIFLFVNPAALMVSRVLLRGTLGALRRRGWGLQRVAIVGSGRLAQTTFDRLQRNPWLGVHVDYFVDEEEERRADEIRSVPVRGGLSNLLDSVREHPVDGVFVAIPSKKADRMDDILEKLASLPVTVAVIPDFSGTVTLSASVGELEGLPVVQLRDTPVQGWNAVAKRTIDVVGSLVLLALFGVPMLVLALLVKLTSPGPVLFRQERMGLGGRPFALLKLRSMRVDAEKETGPVWACQDDSRRTRVGAFMRRASLDELPQLLNVLKGDMSLVGPRPERPHFVEQFVKEVPAYMLRHHVKAGLTGWAQVNGLRGSTSLEKRLQYDLYYINNWSLGFDLFILLLTPLAALFSRSAY